MTKSISLIAITLLSGSVFAAGSSETETFAKFTIERCADAKDEQPGISKALILESVISNICAGLRSTDRNPETNKNFLAANADMKEIGMIQAECMATAAGVNHDRFAGAPESTEKVDLHEAMSQVAENVGARTSMDSPCGDGKMCGTGADALKAKKACQDFVYWDTFRRTADLIGTADYEGNSPDPARNQMLEGLKASLEEAAFSQAAARGHVKIPARAR